MYIASNNIPSSFNLNLFVLVLMQYLIIKIVINYILPKQKVLDAKSWIKGFQSEQAFYTSYLYLAFKDD